LVLLCPLASMVPVLLAVICLVAAEVLREARPRWRV